MDGVDAMYINLLKLLTLIFSQEAMFQVKFSLELTDPATHHQQEEALLHTQAGRKLQSSLMVRMLTQRACSPHLDKPRLMLFRVKPQLEHGA